MNPQTVNICHQFWQNTQVPRNEIIHKDGFLSANADANTSWSGYVGDFYHNKKVLFIGHFPAGGTTGYDRSAYSAMDRKLYDVMIEFKNSEPELRLGLFNKINTFSRDYIPEWSIYRVMDEVFKTTRLTLDDVAYLNAVPYRIEENRKPSIKEIDSAWNKCTKYSLTVLDPAFIICLGQATADIVKRFYTGTKTCFTLRRRIGDKSIDPTVFIEAMAISEHLMKNTKASF